MLQHIAVLVFLQIQLQRFGWRLRTRVAVTISDNGWVRVVQLVVGVVVEFGFWNGQLSADGFGGVGRAWVLEDTQSFVGNVLYALITFYSAGNQKLRIDIDRRTVVILSIHSIDACEPIASLSLPLISTVFATNPIESEIRMGAQSVDRYCRRIITKMVLFYLMICQQLTLSLNLNCLLIKLNI